MFGVVDNLRFSTNSWQKELKNLKHLRTICGHKLGSVFFFPFLRFICLFERVRLRERKKKVQAAVLAEGERENLRQILC